MRVKFECVFEVTPAHACMTADQQAVDEECVQLKDKLITRGIQLLVDLADGYGWRETGEFAASASFEDLPEPVCQTCGGEGVVEESPISCSVVISECCGGCFELVGCPDCNPDNDYDGPDPDDYE